MPFSSTSSQSRGNNPISGHYLSEGDRKDLQLASSELQSKLDLLHKVSLHYDFLIPPPPTSSSFNRQEAINKLARRTLHPVIFHDTPSHGFNSHSHFAVHNFLVFNHGFLSEILDYLDFRINWDVIDLNDRIYGPGVPENLDYVETMYDGREGLRVFLKWIGGWGWVSNKTSRDTPKAWMMVDDLMPALSLIKKGIMDCQTWIDQAENFDYPHDELRADVSRILKKCGMDFGGNEREEEGDWRRVERFATEEREETDFRQEERRDRRSWSRSTTSESGDDGSRFQDAQNYERRQGSDDEERSTSSHSSHSNRAAWRFAQQLAKEDRALEEHRRIKAQQAIDEEDQLFADVSLPGASPARKGSPGFSGQSRSDILKSVNLQNADEDYLTVDIWENPALKEKVRNLQTLRDRLAQEKAEVQKLADDKERAKMLLETPDIRSDTTGHPQALSAATRQKASARSPPSITGDDRAWVTESSDKGKTDFDVLRDLPPDHQKLRQKAIEERKLALEAQRQALYIKNLAQGIMERERLLLQTEPIIYEPNADSLMNSATAGSLISDGKKSYQEHPKVPQDAAEGLWLQGKVADEVGTWGWEAEEYSAYGQVIPGLETHVETQLNPVLQDPKIAVKDQVDNLHHSEDAKVSAACESNSVSRAEDNTNSVASLPLLPPLEVEDLCSDETKLPQPFVFKSFSSEKDDENGSAFDFTSSQRLTGQPLLAYSSPKSSDRIGSRIFTSSIMQLRTAPHCSPPANDDGKRSVSKFNALPSAVNDCHSPPPVLSSPPSSPPHIPKPQCTARPPIYSSSVSETSSLFSQSPSPLRIEEQQVTKSRASSTSEDIGSPQASTQPLTPGEEAPRDRVRKRRSDKKKRQKAARKAVATALAAEEAKDKGADMAGVATETCTADTPEFVDTGKGKKRKTKKKQDISTIAASSVGPLARMWGKDREALEFAGREI